MANPPPLRSFPVPWNDHATLVHFRVGTIESGAREVLAEGPLHRMIELAAELPSAQRCELLLALPDRRQPPFRYQGEELKTLIARPDRPVSPPVLPPRRPVRRR